MQTARWARVVAVVFFVSQMIMARALLGHKRVFRRAVQSALSTSAGTQHSVKRVLVPMANGTEEIEAVTIIDTLVRGGIKVVSATVHADGLEVTCSRGVKLVTDCFITDCVGQNFDMIVCPGGMPGSEHLRDSVHLTEMLKKQGVRGGMIGAICAAPAIVLKTHGLLDNPSRPATGYPADKFKAMIGPGYVAGDSIVVSGSVITSQGPGTAMPFAVKLIELLVGREKAEAVAKEMLISAPK